MQPAQRFYSIDFTGTNREYATLEDATRAKGLFAVVESWEDLNNTAFGVTYKNKKYKYVFHQNSSKKEHAEVGPSKLYIAKVLRGNGSSDSYSADNIYTSLSDSNGLLIYNSKASGIRIDGISNAVKQLLEINVIGDYEKYQLVQENIKLKNRIDELEEELENIQNNEE
ncbi:hypothetical protein [Hymenobacter lapidiphilus]|uniref:Uncharacterized protein n=1 Tax=Hymenobacter lapidiphilus TaxID=2608003 RepID=A0A7Y7PP32_9BACT|nr:hypothetical protein [Hymenobacter lapidiphilus]NVO31310.1 hypothetical protein [Hymenobacter lapidiphilus]